jgi:hypothetical protein
MEEMQMVLNDSIKSSLVNALRNLFGDTMADQIVKYLQQENAIGENGEVNAENLEPVLSNLFGQASAHLLHSLLIVQEKSFSKALK